MESDAEALAIVCDALFILVAVGYATRELAPLPKTYLSEIAFPFDVRGCVADLRSATISLSD